MKKRLVLAASAFCVILLLLPINSLAAGEVSEPVLEAENISASGTCGKNAAWKLENETLTISGTGEMDSYFYNPNDPDDDSDPSCTKAPWYSLRDHIKTAVIANGINRVGMSAFFGCSKLTDVTIPDSIRFIDAYAFSGCSGLLSITLPKGITDIQPYTFDGCVNLTEVTIPDGVTTIGMGAFEGCSSLTRVILPGSLTCVGDYSFSYCGSLPAVTIPDNVTSIENHAFAYCVQLKSVTIPHSVEYIGWNAFTDCYELTDVYYEGGKSAWDAIVIDSGNEILEQANIHFEETDAPTFRNVYYYDTIAEAGVNVDLFWNWKDLLNGDSSVYNVRLAQMGAALSAVIEGADFKDETNRILIDEDGTKRLGCDDVKYIEDISPGMAAGIKIVNKSGKTKYIIFIVLRGTTTELDVLNDVRSAMGVSAWGANSVYSELNSCLKDWNKTYSRTYGKIDSTNTKFFVTGHSLGGACANIFSAKLSEKYGQSNVFGYTFAAPSPFTKKVQKNYNNIHNFLCFNDNVPSRLSTQDPWYGNGYYTWFYPEKSSLTELNYTALTGKKWRDTYNKHIIFRLHAPSIYMAFLMTNPELGVCTVSYVRVKCPIDIDVYNSDDELVGRIVNDEVDYDNCTPNVMLAVTEGAKYVYFLTDDTYTIKFTGTGDGTMVYTAASKDMNSGIDEESKVYSNVEISTGKTFKSIISSYDETNRDNQVKISDVELFVTDNKGNTAARVLSDTEASASPKAGAIMLYIGFIMISGFGVLFWYFMNRRKQRI